MLYESALFALGTYKMLFVTSSATNFNLQEKVCRPTPIKM